jgi:hypothetical protein
MKYLFTCFTLLCSLLSNAQLILDIETGAAIFGYNDIRIPGNSGTSFSFTQQFDNKISPFMRGRVQVNIRERHAVLGLYAPFSVKSSGVLNEDIFFQGRNFASGTRADATWKFNSYRLSYQYTVVLRERFRLALGVTGKIRDAKIALNDMAGNTAEKTNVGFVPLIRFYADWNILNRAWLVLDADALAAKQGRAEDVMLAVAYNPVDPLRLRIGYRLLEGGADNDEVYNFSTVHYGVIGASYIF